MRAANDTDRRDFVDAMKELPPLLAQYVAECMEHDNVDPRTMAAAFATAAATARGWCIGRFGAP